MSKDDFMAAVDAFRLFGALLYLSILLSKFGMLSVKTATLCSIFVSYIPSSFSSIERLGPTRASTLATN